MIKLILAEKDITYRTRFCDYFIAKKSKDFQISSYAALEEMKRDTEMGKLRCDVLAIGEGFCQELPDVSHCKLVMMLYQDRKSINIVPGISQDCITAKYQGMEQIAKVFINKLAEIPTQSQIQLNKKVRILTVFSPIGGCGKSTFAVALLMKLKEEGKRGLYIDLESCPSAYSFLERSSEKGLSYIVSKDLSVADPELLMKGIIQRDQETGIEYLAPMRTVDFQAFSRKPSNTIIELIKCLVNGYEQNSYLVIDLSDGLTALNETILGCSDEIYLITDGREIGINKLNNIDELIESNPDLFEGKTKIVHNFNDGTDSALFFEKYRSVCTFKKYDGRSPNVIAEQMVSKMGFPI